MNENSPQPLPFERMRLRWLFSGWFLGTVILSFALALFWPMDLHMNLFVVSLGELVFMIGILAYFRRKAGLQHRCLLGGGVKVSALLYLPLIVPLKLVSLLFLGIIASLFPINTETLEEFYFWETEDQLVLLLAIGIVLAPIVEEVLFRGLLFQRLAVKWGLGQGIVVSSVIFGLLHLDDFIGATLIGVALCLVYLRTRSLFVPMLLHFSYNAMSLFFTTEQGRSFFQSIDQIPDGLLLLFIAQSLVIVGWFFIAQWPRKGATLPYATHCPIQTAPHA